jgi:hypothetical protein
MGSWTARASGPVTGERENPVGVGLEETECECRNAACKVCGQGRRALKLSLFFLFAAALLSSGCERRNISRDINRGEAIAAAETYLNKAAQRSDLYPKDTFRRVAYERRTTWLVKYVWDGGTGDPPTVEVDKKTGKVILVMEGQ